MVSPTIDIRDPEALADELVRTGRPVADVVHEGRRPNAHQLTALQWISPTCTVEGCPNPNCEVDHEREGQPKRHVDPRPP